MYNLKDVSLCLGITTAFGLVVATPARSDCVNSSGSAYTCSGDFSGQSISLPGDIPDSATSITVSDLTADIGPLSGTLPPEQTVIDLYFDTSASADSVSVTLDSATYSIITSGYGAGGVLVDSEAADGSGSAAGANGRAMTFSSNMDIQAQFIDNPDDTFGVQLVGDGGDGATPAETSGKGTSGGHGGAGSAITTAISGTISTTSGEGELLFGLGLVSRGGTGGDGGQSSNGDGGDGGTGGAGGTLILGTNGDLVIEANSEDTSENRIAGIVALSFGGDGGVGGKGSDKQGSAGAGGDGGHILFSDGEGTTRTITTTGVVPGMFLFTQGGMAGATGHDLAGPSGDGGDITKDTGTTTTITTSGDNAVGLLAISRGGDGVETNSNYNTPGAGGDITIKDSWNIDTNGTLAHGIAAYSVAGQIASDASTAISSSGGEVTLDIISGRITTNGDQSFGLVAQSIAGHDGSGGSSTNPSISFGVSTKTPAGISEAVTITNRAQITTNGQESAGIGAQSTGGGGGSYGSGFDEFFSGEAKAGGAGGDVGVVNYGAITTTNSGSDAIIAQSIGGAGGTGSASTAGSTLGSHSTRDGSDGGIVTVYNEGVLNAGGTGTGLSSDDSSACSGGCSVGILAQSVGGGGGKGHTAHGAFSATGGTGGSGGQGGEVSVMNLGDITTYRDHSAGIEAQSIGGGGGAGGGAVTAGVGFSHAVGGTGGAGGDGGTVTVQHVYADITTDQQNSDGIHAQSVGGGGGRGGYAISGTAQGESLAVGGNGGVGGDGKAVSVCLDQTDSSNSASCQSAAPTTTTATTIITQADNSKGVFAHSVGGGGGNGGFSVAASAGVLASEAYSIGGKGKAGGDAGAVDIVGGVGTIQTAGDDSAAIAALSVGGGGGNGGFAVEGTITLSAPDIGGISLGLALGGNGGSGGAGDDVTVNVTGDLTTTGARSTGILAQSTGGGGGNGGISASGTISAGSDNVGVGLSIGGSGGSGNDAGAVGVTYGQLATNGDSAQIATSGHAAHGIAAQSLGGGGGHGGMALSSDLAASGATDVSVSVGGSGGSGGDGGTTTVNSQGDTIQTTGSHSHGILAQSTGGGGGFGGFSMTGSLSSGKSNTLGVSVGGDGNEGGTGSTVSVTNATDITVQGDKSKGIVAQSVGGAGGYGGMSVTGTVTFNDASKTASVSVGGSGGSGGSAGKVMVNNSGAIVTGNVANEVDSTSNHHEYGILAQSISGNGGYGGMSINGETNAGQKSMQVTIGGSGGGADGAGEVDVTNTADITTNSYNSDAVLAQSIGGNGGAGGSTLVASLAKSSSTDANTYALSIGGKGGSSAEGKTVTVTHSNGNITTQGENSAGIVAQSIGGGGGNGGANIAYSASPSVSKATASKMAVNIGGGGGDGSASGAVTVNFNSGNIVTGEGVTQAQDDANRHNRGHGIFALSQAGGGGAGGIGMEGDIDAGSDGGALTLGGDGGSAAVANTVTVTSNGSITTKLMNSDGILAQSIGGGGGNGAIAVDGDVSNSGSKGVFGSIGGTGAGGSNGGTVKVTANASIVTQSANARGIAAQSIGGGGGDGGVGVSGSVTSEDKSGNDGQVAGLAMGGSGGHASDGGAVTVTLNSKGSIFTLGTDTGPHSASHGIFAQSIGGGGGNGGYGVGEDVSTDVNGGAAAVMALGGTGGASGAGGTVTVDHYGEITTAGNFSYGILGQSVGGGGGAGGLSIGGQAKSSQGQSIVLGAQGSSSHVGDGGTINAKVTGAVTTQGDVGHGIVLQSIGGGGGNVGAAMLGGTAVASAPSDAAGSFEMVLGAGSNSSGGTGGSVNFNTTAPSGAVGNITTAGSASSGLILQSIGGGGGTAVTMFGGSSANGNATIANGLGVQDGTVSQSNGGAVDAVNYARITTGTKASSDDTLAIQSHGIIAQSIGAGGGIAYTTGTLSLNGSKTVFNFAGALDSKGDAFGINLANQGAVTTYGTDSHALVSQAIGGGGGLLGNMTKFNLGSGHTYYAETNLGGFSDNSGDHDNSSALFNHTQVTNAQVLTTHGDGSYGILVQNITGGGGYASSMFGMAAALENPTQTKMNLGKSQVGGYGTLTKPSTSAVSVKNLNNITTHGDGATALMAQSIGGGGGVAFDGGWNAKTTTPFETISAYQSDAEVFILGGGATGGDNNNSMGASADAVTVAHENGAITTSGWGSSGIYAQSVGAGGGRAMTGVVTSDSTSPYVGGYAGSEGDGGDVTVTVSSGASVTAGANDNTYAVSSFGVFAQSVGGGGGHGGVADFQGANVGTNLHAESFLTNTDGGGGIVNVTIDGSVSTYGNSSLGVFAQSVGGGGGVIGTPTASTAVSVGSNGGHGNAGDVGVTIGGAVTTVGQAAHGVLAQSASGSNHKGSDVKVTVNSGASVKASNKYSYGVWMDSAGGDGGGDTSLKNSGTVSGGCDDKNTQSASKCSDSATDPTSVIAATDDDTPVTRAGIDTAAGVVITNSASADIVNTGTLTTEDGVFGHALRSDADDLLLRNSGTLVGEGYHFGSRARVRNTAAGTILAGATWDLGGTGNGRLLNQGRMEILGDAEHGTTMINGDFIQSGTGVLSFDLSPGAGDHDSLSVTGTAQLEGGLTFNLLDLGTSSTGAQTVTLLSADGGLTVPTGVPQVADRAVVAFDTAASDTGLQLTYAVDFMGGDARSQLLRDEQAVATYLTALQDNGEFTDLLLDLTEIETIEDYATQLSGLSGDVYADSHATVLFSNMGFELASSRCQAVGLKSVQDGRRSCVWVEVTGERIDVQANSQTSGFNSRYTTISGGGDRELDNGLVVGGALQYVNYAIDSGIDTSSDGYSFQGLLRAERSRGNTTFGGFFGGGNGWFDVTRTALGTTAQADYEVPFINFGGFVRHRIEHDTFFLQPSLNFGVANFFGTSGSETIASGVGLNVSTDDQTVAYIRPALMVGTDRSLGNGRTLSAFGELGLTAFSRDKLQVTGAFQGASAASGSFTASSSIGDPIADLNLGATLASDAGWSLKAAAFGSLSNDQSSVGARLNLGWSF